MARVLTTSAEKGSGVGAIQALQNSPHQIIATSTDPRGAGLYLSDQPVITPPVTSEEWPTSIANAVEEHNVDVVLPLNDEDLKEIDRLSATLPDDVPLVIPRQAFIKEMLDKKKAYALFEKRGLQIPETTTAEHYEEFSDEDFPRIIKPRWGSRARGVELLETQTELVEYISKSTHSVEDLLIQEYINGDDYTSNLAITQNNRLLSTVIKEVKERDGFSRWAVTRNHDQVREACLDAFNALQPAGPMNVQHMVDETGEPYLIEINPRFSGSSCLNAEAGVNEYDLLVRSALGEEVEPINEYETGLNLIRYHDRLYVRDEELLSTDSKQRI
ncbi:ATP-grasp domain-containing protein [Natrialbaceae archaeon A-CW1-1]